MSNLKVDGVEPNSTAAVTVGGTGNLTTAGSSGNLVVGGTATVGGTLHANGAVDAGGQVVTAETITATTINAISSLQINGDAISVTRGITFLGISNGTAVRLRGSTVGLAQNGHSLGAPYAVSGVAWAGLASIKVSATLRSGYDGTSWTFAFQVLVGTTWITMASALPLASANGAYGIAQGYNFEIHNANFAANSTAPASVYSLSGQMAGEAPANGQIIGFRFTSLYSMDVKIQAWGISL